MGVRDKIRAAQKQEQAEQEARAKAKQQSAPRTPPTVGSNGSNGASSNGPGPFDILAELAEWSDILDPADWESVTPADADTSEAWRHPNATHPISAKVPKANPHVIVAWSTDCGLPTGADQKLTKGRVYAWLHHGGDKSAAATAMLKGEADYLPQHLREAVKGTGNGAYQGQRWTGDGLPSSAFLLGGGRGGPGAEQDQGDPQDDQGQPEPESETTDTGNSAEPDDSEEKFWNSRPVLAHIRRFAYARMAPPWAVLGVSIIRTLDCVPPTVFLPAIVGGRRGSLNLFAALVAPSGGGKGAAEGAAEDALDLSDQEIYTVPLGSGEGIAHQYAYREKGNPDIVWVRNHVTFSTSEIDAIAALTNRSGSTLSSQLRAAYMGERLGFAYADAFKRIILPPHSYRFGLVVGVQPERAGFLLDQSDGGFPQRFIWSLAIDRAITANPPPEPEPMWIGGTRGSWRPWKPGAIPVHDQVRIDIREARAAQQRGETHALDGHALFSREKVAFALALWENRREIDLDDWLLAGVIMNKSDATREAVAGVLRRKAREAEGTRALNEGRREVIKGGVVADAELQRACQAILRKLGRAGDWVAGKVAKDATGKHRDHFDEAVHKLEETGQIEVETVDYQSQQGIRLRLSGTAE